MTVWIKSGTVAVTNGSATVQGTGTGLYGKVAPGYAFVGPDARIYEVVSVNVAEQITLASPYIGATTSGAAYAIYPTLGLAAQLVAAVQALISAQQAIEASQVVAANGDRSFYSAEGSVIAVLKNSGLFGVGTANPTRPVHIYQPLATSSTRMRLENGDGWTDILADNSYFRVTSNTTGGGDTNFLNYDGLYGRLGVNVVGLDQLHVHEPSANASVLRMSNTEGGFRILQDAGDNLFMRPAGAADNLYSFFGYGRLDVRGDASNNNHKLGVFTQNISYGNHMVRIAADRPGSNTFDFLRAYSSGELGDTEFKMRGDGDAFADGSWNGGGADFAEFFEWEDGNTAAEDRRGVSVVLSGHKIRPALIGEDPFGVVSANPTVVGDADLDRWKGKYLRDEYGTYVWEDFQVVSWEALRPTQDPDTGEFGGAVVSFSFAEDAVPEGVTIPEDAEYVTEQRRVLNQEWNPEEVYIPRAERPEWDPIGFQGKLHLRKGQPVGSRWIKMRDITEDVEEWLVR